MRDKNKKETERNSKYYVNSESDGDRDRDKHREREREESAKNVYCVGGILIKKDFFIYLLFCIHV